MAHYDPVEDERTSRISHFTYKDLHRLKGADVESPLRVVALLHLDCFYAQCEIQRRKLSDDTPLVVTNFSKLVSYNYAARRLGVKHDMSPTYLRTSFPKLDVQHVPLWRLGESDCKYRDDPNDATDKVCFESYRSRFRDVMDVVEGCLAKGKLRKIEKVHFTEMFLDLSAQVHALLIERFPFLAAALPGSQLPPAPADMLLPWKGVELPGGTNGEFRKPEGVDWDEVALHLGSEIAQNLQLEISKQLGFTCSIGVGHNKTVAKAASFHDKDDRAHRLTVVTRQHTLSYLSTLQLYAIRGFSQAGDRIKTALDTGSISELQKIDLDTMKRKIGKDGPRLYKKIRGEDDEKVFDRTETQEMSAEKVVSITNQIEAEQWLLLLVNDILNRLTREKNRRPTKLVVFCHRNSNYGAPVRSKECAIRSEKDMTREYLYKVAKTKMIDMTREGRPWPWQSLSFQVLSFQPVHKPNYSILAFYKPQKVSTGGHTSRNLLSKDVASPGDEQPVSESSRKRAHAEIGPDVESESSETRDDIPAGFANSSETSVTQSLVQHADSSVPASQTKRRRR